jgi:hypothetical protein
MDCWLLPTVTALTAALQLPAVPLQGCCGQKGSTAASGATQAHHQGPEDTHSRQQHQLQLGTICHLSSSARHAVMAFCLITTTYKMLSNYRKHT